LIKHDSYTWYARIYPIFVVFSPIVFTCMVWFQPLPGFLTGILSSGIASILFAQLGRDQGKYKESKLFEIWGGNPAICMLRYRDSVLSPVTVKRIHEKLAGSVANTSVISQEEEKADIVKADAVYLSWIEWLRSVTRDQARFPLLFVENKNYGFRRNLWGMKPIGIGVSILSLAVAIIILYGEWKETGAILPIAFVSFIFSGLFVFLWIFWFTPAWVRVAGESYARRLLEAVERL